MTRITTLDLPFLFKSGIGFDRVFNEMETQFANSKQNYPPYNIAEISEDEYMISLAVAGFGMDNLKISQEANQLSIEGDVPKGEEKVNYLHKGIGERSFRRDFTLAEHVEVQDARLELGILNIHLKRNVPEEKKPKLIKIKG